jgi:hypothetical protein
VVINASDSVLSIPEEYPRSSPESPNEQNNQIKQQFRNNNSDIYAENADAVVSTYYINEANNIINDQN